MGFKTWSAGDVLTATDVNAYLMKQSVIVCTSGTQPSVPVEGMTIYETDTDLFRVYTGSAWVTIGDPAAWTDYTPTWTGATTNPVIGNGTIAARYKQVGKTVRYTGRILMGSTTTYGSGRWLLTLPVTAQVATLHVGAALCFDATAANSAATVWFNAATTMVASSTGGDVSGTVPFTWTTSDQFRWSITYEAA